MALKSICIWSELWFITKKTNTQLPALLDAAPASNIGFLAANKHRHVAERAARVLLKLLGFTLQGLSFVIRPESDMPAPGDGGRTVLGRGSNARSPPDSRHVRRTCSTFTNDQNNL